VLRLATRDAGVVSVIARGARRSKQRFGPALDLFASGVAEIHMRAGRDLQQLTAFDLAAPRHALAADLDRFGSASMLAELAARCTAGDEEGELFQALTDALEGLLDQRDADALLYGVRAAWQLTSALGFAPAVDDCATCHSPVESPGPAHFASRAGGVLCERCAAQEGCRRVLPADARGVLRRWLAGDASGVSDHLARRAHARLLREFVLLHVAEGQELRALEAWERRFAGVADRGTAA
jgi:DNA repair protein RecO (recombination protein O)